MPVTLEVGFVAAYRYTLETNQHSSHPAGAFACTFISHEFLTFLLLDMDRFQQTTFKLANELASIATQCMIAGGRNHKHYCFDKNLSINSPKKSSLVHSHYYQNSLLKIPLLVPGGQAKHINDAFTHNFIPKPSDINKELNLQIPLSPIPPEQEEPGEELEYNPVKKNFSFTNKKGIPLPERWNAVGYVLCAESHAISVLRYGNVCILFNSYPEVRGCHKVMKLFRYRYGKGYILMFTGPNSLDDLCHYISTKLWLPDSIVQAHAYLPRKTLHT